MSPLIDAVYTALLCIAGLSVLVWMLLVTGPEDSPEKGEQDVQTGGQG